MIDEDRAEALTAARLAVRAYAKAPTPDNAAEVETAYSALRNIDEQAAKHLRRLAERNAKKAANQRD